MKLLIYILFASIVIVATGVAADEGFDPWQAVRNGEFDRVYARYVPLAEDGNTDAQLFLGNVASFRNQDDEAVEWYRRAADGGDAQAMALLATSYMQGKGVQRDPLKAYAWYALASEAGHPNADRARDAIATQMSEGQVAEASELADQWRLNGVPQAEAADAGPE